MLAAIIVIANLGTTSPPERVVVAGPGAAAGQPIEQLGDAVGRRRRGHDGARRRRRRAAVRDGDADVAVSADGSAT